MLYVVATPIGNLQDMTFRAVQTLQRMAVIACEDTRVSRKLCEHFGITAPLVAYHDHNEAQALPALLARLQAGEEIALISDAGTPLVSDPGYRLVKEAIAAGIRVVPIAGVCSVIAALSAAGLPTDRFFFAGFLPNKHQMRIDRWQELAAIDATIITFESAKRLAESLSDAASVMPMRYAVVAREITKLYEEFRRGSLQELAEHYAHVASIKGEIVLMIAPPHAEASPVAQHFTPLLDALLPHYSVKHAASLVADALGLPRKTVYSAALVMKNSGQS